MCNLCNTCNKCGKSTIEIQDSGWTSIRVCATCLKLFFIYVQEPFLRIPDVVEVVDINPTALQEWKDKVDAWKLECKQAKEEAKRLREDAIKRKEELEKEKHYLPPIDRNNWS